MSHFDRKIEYLNKHKVIYRRNPINDKPTKEYEWGYYYEHGTYECYTLFNSKAKITTYKSLKWHLYVLWYLNPQLDQKKFNYFCKFICEKSNGFVTFTVSEQLFESMVHDVYTMDLEQPPPNKVRKIIFKDYSGLSMKQKLSIVGKMVGKSKISESEIYDAMLLINNDNIKITVNKLADSLHCSTRTIYRNMGNELKKEKQLLNNQL